MDYSFGTVILFMSIGFLAQLANGGVGAGFGVITNTVLISLGIPPVVSSGTIHTAEIFTSANLAYWHWREGNLEPRMFRALVFTGVLGGFVGALVLTYIKGSWLQPFIILYLLALGLLIFKKGWLRAQSLEFKGIRYWISQILGKTFKRAINWFYPSPPTSRIFTRSLGFLAAFFDAIGGGGWGAITTSTLVIKGENPRLVIGSISAAEFFVTLTISGALLSSAILWGYWPIVLSLVLGGSLAAPISAKVCKKLPTHWLMMLIGGLISSLSLLMFYWLLWPPGSLLS